MPYICDDVVHVYICPTFRCFNQCSYCYIKHIYPEKRSTKSDLKVDFAEKHLKAIVLDNPNKLLSANIFCGEPTIYNDIERLLVILLHLGFQYININTSLTHSDISTLFKYPINIIGTFCAPQEYYNEIRGGKYQNVYDNLCAVAQRIIKINIPIVPYAALKLNISGDQIESLTRQTLGSDFEHVNYEVSLEATYYKRMDGEKQFIQNYYRTKGKRKNFGASASKNDYVLMGEKCLKGAHFFEALDKGMWNSLGERRECGKCEHQAHCDKLKTTHSRLYESAFVLKDGSCSYRRFLSNFNGDYPLEFY